MNKIEENSNVEEEQNYAKLDHKKVRQIKNELRNRLQFCRGVNLSL